MVSNNLLRRAVKTALLSGACASVGLLPISPVLAQSTQGDSTAMEEVVVTGTLIRGVNTEASLPVTVVTSEDIAKSGVDTLEQLVSRISSTATAGGTRQSDTAGLATYGQSTVSLRGLGESRTLVLLNGRRLSVFANGTTAAVDINSIPLSAIERVEVLRDGASSSYGSDAVAGVINFILRKNYNGAEITADVGKPTQAGRGSITRFNLLTGMNTLADGKVSFMFGGSVETNQPVAATDRSYSSSGNQPPYFQNAATPSGRIEGVWIPGQTRTQNSRTDTNPFGYSSSGYGNPYAPDRCGEINMYDGGTGGVTGDLPNCFFDSAPYVDLVPKSKHYDAFATFNAELTSAMQLYVEANYARNVITEAYQPSPVNASFLASDLAFDGSGVDPALLIFPTNPAYQSIVVPYLQSNGLSAMVGQPLAVTLRSFLTGLRTEKDTNTQTRFVVGLKGDIGSWNYDVGALYNESKTDGEVTDGYFSQLELARVLNSSNWNPWAPGGAQNPTIANALQAAQYVGPTIAGDSTLESIDATFSGKVAELSGGDLRIAVGGTVRRERYQVSVPDILNSGDIAGLGGAVQSEDDTRTTSAIYAEANLPLIKTVEVNASARTDHYSDVGSTTTGKISGRWQPIDQLAFRASAGTGFRAPSLVELHQPVTIGTSEQYIDPLFPDNGQVQANAIIGGNPNLKPEKSKQFSIGILATPIRSLKLSADYFYIKINNYITQPAALALINGMRAGAPLYGSDDATFAPDGEVDTVNQINRNAASALLRGVDVNVNWVGDFGFGKLMADLNGTYMDTFDLTTLVGVQHSVGTIVQPDGTPLDVASLGVVTRWKHTLTLGWELGPWATTVTQNFYSRYRDANDLNGDPHYVPNVVIYDAQVAFSGIPNLNVAVGARNVFQKRPPIFIGNGSSFQYGYDPTMFDPRGRFIYFRATYKFL